MENTFKYLRENKQLLITKKKSALKFGDCVSALLTPENENVVKSIDNGKPEKFNVNVAINTTNLMDSHDDVHLPGIWNKSIKENKNVYLLQEHKMQFDKIISDDLKVKAVTMTWKELGYNFDGTTQALIFSANIEKDRNEYMAEQYLKNRVKNHSVGMQYVKIDLAINSTSPADKEEKKIWDKYINQIANKELAEEKGYFWAVTEAKLIEGSAVPIGSNFATPTISITAEPDKSTPETIEPPVGTQKTGYEIFNY